IGISPYEGQRHVIVKRGNSGNSKRAKVIDLGNLVKAKIHQRHHWYLSEAEISNSFPYLKKDLRLIVLYQALLSVLKIAYVLPEKKLFFTLFSTLRDLEEEPSKERQELALFLLILRVLAHYELITFPFVCKVCGKKLYEGYFDGNTYYCEEHKPPQ